VRALLILHDHVSAGGFVTGRLRERGWEVDERIVVPAERFASPGVEFDFPAPDGYDLLIPAGAPWSAYDDTLTWLGPELAWLRAAHHADVPILAICFGAQALARALGGRVSRSPRPEIGYAGIETDDPLLVGPGPWFQWHYDMFTPPPAAREIARNKTSPQAYVVGRSLGVQFHPEVTPEIAQAWLSHGGAAQAERHGLDPTALLRDARDQREAAATRAAALVDAYLARAFPGGHAAA
jgi:GMP synthase-like glutamine amidotransferase